MEFNFCIMWCYIEIINQIDSWRWRVWRAMTLWCSEKKKINCNRVCKRLSVDNLNSANGISLAINLPLMKRPTHTMFGKNEYLLMSCRILLQILWFTLGMMRIWALRRFVWKVAPSGGFIGWMQKIMEALT